MIKTLVLGSGPSALAYLHSDPEAVALAGPNPGGQFAQADRLGPQLLWVSEETERLLEQLGMPLTRRSVLVGYYLFGQLRLSQQMPASAKEWTAKAYAMKTRGTEPRSTYMSEGKSSYEVYRIGVTELAGALLERVGKRLILDSAAGVDLTARVVVTRKGERINFGQLVSTIPAPALVRMMTSEEPDFLVARDKAYLPVGDLEPWMATALAYGVDYAYCPDPEQKYHRVKFTGSQVIAEYTFPKPVPDCFHPKANVLYHPKGQIVSGHEELAHLLSGLPVTLLGRYAEWRHGIKFHDVLKKIAALKDAAKTRGE